MTLNNVRPISLTLQPFKPTQPSKTKSPIPFPSNASGDSYGGVTFGSRHNHTKKHGHSENDITRPDNVSPGGLALLCGIGLLVSCFSSFMTRPSSGSRHRKTSHSQRHTHHRR